MTRTLVSLRRAVPADAPVLLELWGDLVRRADPEEQVGDLCRVIESCSAGEHERLLVAEYDGAVVGAVHLRVTTVSSLNLERAVRLIGPHVLPDYRRRGVGRVLMEAAVTWAEESGAGHLTAAAGSTSRDANRFLARLGMGPQQVLRLAPTGAVRAKLAAQAPVNRVRTRQLTQVLAARRSMRRSGEVASTDGGPTVAAAGDPVG